MSQNGMGGLDGPEGFQNPELALERFGRANLQRNGLWSLATSCETGNVTAEL